MFERLSLKSRMVLVGAALALLLAAFSVFLAFSVAGLQSRFQRDGVQAEGFSNALLAAEQAHIAFKIEIQEWKNVLLRGHRREDLDRYSNQYREQHLKVQRLLARCRAELNRLQVDAAEVDAIAVSHLRLHGDYLRMLEQADLEAHHGYRKIDEQVRGRDRALDEQISKFVNSVEAQYERSAANQQEQRGEDLRAISRQTVAAALSLLLLLGLALALIARNILHQLGGDPSEVSGLVGDLASGDLQAVGHLKDAHKQAAHSLVARVRQLSDGLKALAEQADAIGSGDLSQDVRPRSERDRLGLAFQRMTELLRQARTVDVERMWVGSGRSELAATLTGDYDSQQLAERAVSALGRHCQAGRGVLHVWNPQTERLELLASYMYTERAEAGASLRLGEGAIGQVARERKPIHLAHAEDAPLIRTGTVQAPALHTYTLPVQREGRLLGVLELALPAELPPQRQDFLTEACEIVAAYLYVAEQREDIRRLLKLAEASEREARASNADLQRVNAQMEEQQQLLQQQSEELQQSNAQMEEQQQQLQQQSEELRQANAQLEAQQSQMAEANAELEQRAHAIEQASGYKSQFLANMSHELRTPLNAILLLSKMLADNVDGRLGAEEAKRARVIQRSGEDLLRLINDVLDLAKVEAGRMELQLESLDSAELATGLRDLFGPAAQAKGLELTVDDRLQRHFVSDANRLGQILRNLMANAIKFTREGGVTLTMSRDEGDGMLCFSVQDTGIGIAPDKQGQVFESFVQADGSTAREFGGTGLGLTISRRFAELLGGAIQLRSEKGRGSCFTLRLPDAAGAPVAASAQALVDDRERLLPGDRALLLVDDDPQFAAALLTLNRPLGRKTLVAGNAAEGIQLARRYRPAGILLDLGLPDRDGRTLLHELKADPELASIPVFIVSARDKQDARLGAESIVGYLQKPADAESLGAAQERLLAQSAAQPHGLLLAKPGAASELRALINLAPGLTLDWQQLDPRREAPTSGSWALALVDLSLIGVAAALQRVEGLRALQPGLPLLFYSRRPISEDEEASLRPYSDTVVIESPGAGKRLSEAVERCLGGVASAFVPIAPPRPAQAPRLAQHHVLVVDDDPRNLFVLTAALEDNGAKVSTAINGRRALERLEQGGIELVLSDVMMPEMDGYQTLAAIRADPRWAKLPVIVLTAKAMPTDRQELLAAGASDYLAKPVDYGQLIDLVERWCKP